jgi:uncharacterized iron-regulated protein
MIALLLVAYVPSEVCGNQAMIIDVLMGEPVSLQTMTADLETARIIYLGEIHSIRRHHDLQATLLKTLVNRGNTLAVGLEMFSVAQQETLNRWLAGDAPLDHLRRDLGKDYWTNLGDYRRILETARKLNLPVIALNAPTAVVKKVAAKGLDALTPEERKLMPDGVDEIHPHYDRLLRLRLRVHRSFQHGSLDRIVLAQVLRDQTMASSIAGFLKTPAGQDRLLLVIAGAGHVSYGFGIPERVNKLTDVRYRIVLPSESGELVLSDAEQRQAVPVHISHSDLMFIRSPIADYLHVLPLKDAMPEGPDDAPPVLEASTKW